ncbi:hypothetical protein HY837_01030 [archaeon]|nr:hypothetical protein [archaeon]
MNLIDLIKRDCKDGYFGAMHARIKPLLCNAEESQAVFQAFHPIYQFSKWQLWLPEPFLLLAKDQDGLENEYGKYNFFIMHYVPKKRRAVKGIKEFGIKDTKHPFLSNISRNSCIYFESTGGEKSAGRNVIMPLLYGPKETMKEAMKQLKVDPKSVFDLLQQLMSPVQYDKEAKDINMESDQVKDNTKWIHIYDLLTKQTIHTKYENPKFEA